MARPPDLETALDSQQKTLPLARAASDNDYPSIPFPPRRPLTTFLCSRAPLSPSQWPPRMQRGSCILPVHFDSPPFSASRVQALAVEAYLA